LANQNILSTTAKAAPLLWEASITHLKTENLGLSLTISTTMAGGLKGYNNNG